MSIKKLVTPSIFLLLCLLSITSYAHGVDDETKSFLLGNKGVAFGPFLYIGAKHMITGYDHLLFLVGVIFFFDGSFRNGTLEMQSTVNKIDGPASGMSRYSKAEPSTGVGQPRQSQNVASSVEKRPIPNMARDNTSRGHQQEQSKTVSGVQPSVGFPGVATAESSLEESSASLPKQVISKSEYDGTGTSVVQKTESSVQPGEAIDRQSVNSSDNVHEGRSALEEQATRTMPRKNSTVLRAVREGENLSQIVMETYGSENVKYLEWVKQHNPDIVNPDFILPGQYVVLPEYRKNEVSQ
jgi:hypothetical protein